MATDPTKFERLRAVGLSEKYSTARHPIRFYVNVALTASYTIPETYTLPLKDYVYKAVETLINQHPILSAIPLGEDTENPYWVRLPDIDLAQSISFQQTAKRLTLDDYDEELKDLLQTQHGTGFTVPLPFWRLIVLTSDDSDRHFTAVFVYHHAVGDGTSGKAFHRTFLQALRGAASLQAGEAKQIIIPPKSNLLPPLEDVHPLPLSVPYLLKILFRAYFPSKPSPKHWAGGKIQTPSGTKIGVLRQSAAQTLALVKNCREHGTTVTCAVETAIARSVFASISKEYTRIMGSVPITQRPWLPDIITDESMGVFVQEAPEYFSRDVLTTRNFPWPEAQRVRNALKKELALESKNTSVGLFKLVRNYRQDLCESKIDKPRPATFELSSLGVVKTVEAADVSIPQLNRVIFTQSASVTGAALQFSAVTGPDGCLVLGVSWQPGVVEEEVAGDILGRLKYELDLISE
ncbi:alcohol acetyltransferase [Aspergillus unguis]